MTIDWQPYASLDIIQQRANFYNVIRRFMEENAIMEVDTPALSRYGNTDPNLNSFKTQFHSPADTSPVTFFLNTSPEFAMKRLLASGSGSIYQICKVFRDNESGTIHQPEFTMLEWYQVGCDHQQFMGEVARLMSRLGYRDIERRTYADLFEYCTGVDPHHADTTVLLNMALKHGLGGEVQDRGVLLDFIFSHAITPTLEGNSVVFVYDYPSCQASLSRIRDNGVAVAERFELFIGGVEIANGFHELSDPEEQLSRFKIDNQKRREAGEEEIPIDKMLIRALKHGLPDCAGVAIGLDRLFMKMLGKTSIDEVITFTSNNA